MNVICAKIPYSKEELILVVKLVLSFGFSYSVLFFIPLISLQYAGHKDKDLLAAVGLGISFGNAFGFTTVIGIDFTCQTLCSQARGAKNHRRTGILLQRGIILLLVLSMPIFSLWLNAEKILLGLSQKEYISRIAGEFLTWYLPVLWLFGLFRFLNSYLACQDISRPQIIAGFLACVTSILANYVFTIHLDIGVPGYALSTGFAYLIGCLFLAIYIHKCVPDWPGWSLECLEQWWQFMILLIPGNFRVLLDWGTSEAGVLLMGLLGSINLGAMLAVFNTNCFLYVVLQGFAVTACVRVGNFLGAGDVSNAKRSAVLISVLGVLMTTTNVIILLAIKDYLGYMFTSDKSVIQLVSKVVPLAAAYHYIDGNVAISCGILNGLGLQKYVAIISFIGFNVIGLPLSIVFAFEFNWQLLGYLAGQLIGCFILVLSSIIAVFKSNWLECSELAIERARLVQLENEENSETEAEEKGEVDESIKLIEREERTTLYYEKTVYDTSLFSILGRIVFVTSAFLIFVGGLIARISI